MKRLWLGFVVVVLASFAVLGWAGVRVYQEAPPVPDRVVTDSGREVIGRGEIAGGQDVWRSLGGMEMGSIWGHGSYVAPDWTADYLHREAVEVLDRWARARYGAEYASLKSPEQAALRDELQSAFRVNRYDPATRTLTIADARGDAFEANQTYYADVFGKGRPEFAIPAHTLTDPARARRMAAFFFWSSWAASTNRPGDSVTYTSNWPHEPLVGNRPTGEAVVWTGVSIIMLLGGIGYMAFRYAKQEPEAPTPAPASDPLLGSKNTPSQRATVKYFWTVAALALLQIVLGVITAHYGVEGGGFFGIKIDDILPYTVTRTWHTQLGILWIATAWLAAGLFIAPAVGGAEPKYQRAGVNVLFVALVTVVVGSMAGQWLSVKQMLPGELWYWFGHSGYEYIDPGKVWQIALLVGLFLWLFLMVRAILPALRRADEQRPILTLFLISSVAIAGFYGAALGAGRHTSLAMAEYWRWWVVHLWVEGFFEVFATVVIALLFAKLGLVGLKSAARAATLGATVYLGGGIIGTLHHLYFSGTPAVVMALGAVFSALEVVPLLFVGHEAWENLKRSTHAPWVQQYKWPIYFFVAVAFWNLVGAGLFGFMINPPIALYYMQGLNTTPVHGHAALFGVYGMLGLGLMLFTLRAMNPHGTWRDGLIKFSFWSTNVGLMAMVGLSLLPVGLAQTWASVETGYWYARSPEFIQLPVLQVFRWLRAPGDILFTAGIVGFVIFIAGLSIGFSYQKEKTPNAVLAPVPR
jgi:nitric oxide reductase subunit B